MQTITIDIETLYTTTDTARLADLPEYEAKARALAGSGNEVILTGQGPIWLYLKIAHTLHGKVRKLSYESPVTGKIIVFNHNPFESPEPQRSRERGEGPKR